MHAEVLLLVLIAQVVFLLECGHIHAQSQMPLITVPARIGWCRDGYSDVDDDVLLMVVGLVTAKKG